jgi:hypothetical protein
MARLSQRAPTNDNEKTNLDNIDNILKAVGQENVDVDFNRRGFRRNLLRDLARARAYYNTRLDFTNKGYLERLDGKLKEIKNDAQKLARLLSNDDVVAELQLSVTELQCSLELLIARAKERRRGILERHRIASKWKSASSELGLNTDLVAKLATIFEENFGLAPGYARMSEENAGANTFIRFIKAVFREFGLKERSLGTIGNDLTRAATRINALKS